VHVYIRLHVQRKIQEFEDKICNKQNIAQIVGSSCPVFLNF